MKFGRLSVVDEIRCNGRVKFKCICDCGSEKIIDKRALTRTDSPTRSCGCIALEKARIPKIKHGMSKTREHSIWRGMRDRCKNEKNKSYKFYGAIGINVCERWDSFENFYLDMGNSPSENHSIDRIDTSKGYSPENCKWSTQLEQVRNAKSNVNVEINGEIKCLSEWAELFNVNYFTFRFGYRKNGNKYLKKFIKI